MVLSERTFLSFRTSQGHAEGSCSLCAVCATRAALGLTGNLGSFCVSQASASLASEESHTVPPSGRNKFVFFLIGKTGAFLLSEPCLTLLSSVLSLPQEKN